MDRIEELFRQSPHLQRLLRPAPDELAGLAESIHTLREQRSEDPEDMEVNFQLGGALISHSRLSYVEEGVHLMETLVYKRWQSKWSEVVLQQNDLYSTFATGTSPSGGDSTQQNVAVVRGTTVSRATAPPVLDESDDEMTSETAAAVQRNLTELEALVTGAAGSLEVSDSSSSSNDGDEIDAAAELRTAQQERAERPHRGEMPGLPPLSPTHSTVARSTTTSGTAGSSSTNSSHIAPGMMDDLAVYHYYLALGWIKLRNMDKALSCVNQMLLMAPSNKQGLALKSYIEVAGRRSTATNVATTVAGVSVALAGVTAVMSLFLRGRQSPSS